MPEAFACLFVFAVSLSAYVAAKVQTARSTNNPAADLQRLRRHRAWLEERLQMASRENWDDIMIGRIADEIDATDAQLALACPKSTEVSESTTATGMREMP